MPGPDTSPKRRKSRGFRRAAALVGDDIRKVGEARGFAVSRVLTHWDEIVGPDLARSTRPVDVSFARDGFGGTITVLVPGAEAPMVEMQTPRLIERINACYGYAAIRRIRLTQTAPVGFAEDAAPFEAKPAAPAEPDPATQDKARRAVGDVADDSLRDALAALGARVLSR